MAAIASFTFNPFQENTYILYDETGECVVIDPGCYTDNEKEELIGFINDKNLTPVLLLNTHCHIDHVLGNKYIVDTYGIPFWMNDQELPVLEAVTGYGGMMGIEVEGPLPKADKYLNEGDTVSFGNTTLQVLFTPGHSPGSISFYLPEEKWVIAGDVLFRRSVGRMDLPGGDMDTLMQSIQTKLYTLPDDTTVYAGHMEPTTIGEEKLHNPFIRG